MKEQNDKTLAVYNQFCEAIKQKPFPVTLEVGCAFFGALAETGDYTVSTMSTVFLYSLKWLNWEYTNEKIPVTVTNKINDILKEFRWDPNIKPWRGGMKPLIVNDVKLIIRSIDEWDCMKNSLASLFIFALATGTRAYTCGLIQYKDIITY